MFKKFSEKKLQLFTALLIVTFALFIRFYQLGTTPVGLYWDEIAMYLDAKTVSHNLKDMHGNSVFQSIFSSYGDYKLPMYIWMASATFTVFGASEFALRLPSAIVGILQYFAIYYLLRKLTQNLTQKGLSQTVSILGAFICAFSPWGVLFSRTGFEGFSGQFFITVAVLGLFLSLKSSKWLILSIFCSIAGVYSYYSVRFVWPVLVLSFWGCFVLAPQLFSKNNVKNKLLTSSRSLIPYGIILLIWVVSMIPIFKSPFYPASEQFRLSTSSLLEAGPFNIQSNVNRELSGNNIFSRVLYHGWYLQLHELAENYADHLDINYLFLTGDPNLRHGTGDHGLFYLWCLPLLLSGLYYTFRSKPEYFVFFISWWLIALLPASVPTNIPHALRSLNAFTPIIVFMSFGLIPVYQLYEQVSNKNYKKMAVVISVIVITYQIAMFTVDYFLFYPTRSAIHWQQGYKEIVDTVDDDLENLDKLWINPNDDRFFLWYLAYGPFTVEEIQSGMKDKSIAKRWEKAEFSSFLDDTFDTAVKPFVIVTTPGNLTFKPDREVIIKDAYDQPKYVVGFYDK